MTKKRSYTTLRKKLQELEAELNFFYSLPPEIPETGHQAEDIHQHFLFLKNLLKAEIDSAQSNPDRLHKFERKLAKLENNFCNWELSSTIDPPVENLDSVSPYSSDDEAYSVRSNAVGEDSTHEDVEGVSEISGYRSMCGGPRCRGPWLHGELGFSEQDQVNEEGNNYTYGQGDIALVQNVEDDKKDKKVKSQGVVKARNKKKTKTKNKKDEPVDIGLFRIVGEEEKKGTHGIVEEKKVRRSFGFIKFCGAFLSGMVFGSIMTNMALVDFYPFISNAHEFLIPT